jgi:hypothetical protein
MPVRSLVLATLSIPLLACALTASESFPGWQRLAVIRVGDGCTEPVIARVGGGPALLIAHQRQARIDVLRVDPSAPGDPAPASDEPGGLNRFPLPPGFRHEHIPCPAPPLAAVAVDGAVVALHGPPWRLSRWTMSGDGAWAAAGERDLLSGDPMRRLPLLMTPVPDGAQILIGCQEGIQAVTIGVDGIGRPTWLRPRIQGRGTDWTLTDLDQDGRADLVESFGSGGDRGGVRWQAGTAAGFGLPVWIHDQPVRGLAGLPGAIATLGQHQMESATIHRLVPATAEPLGGSALVPVPDKAVVCGAHLGGTDVLAVAVPGEGRIELHRLTGDRQGRTWADGGAFPAPKGIKAIIAPEPDQILLWVEGQADLLAATWTDGRLSFPVPWQPGAATPGQERAIVGLDSTGTTDWCFQRQGEDLHLDVWDHGAPLRRVTFAQAGAKVSAAQWLNGDRAVARIGFAPDAVLLTVGQPTRTAAEVPLLAKLDPTKIRLVAWPGGRVPGRIVDDAWQWLDTTDGLAATDQLSIEDEAVADVANLPDHGRWAVLAKDRGLVRITAMGGIAAADIVLPGRTGNRLINDRWLGPLLVGGDGVHVLHDGPSHRLETTAVADAGAIPGPVRPKASRICSAPLPGGDALLIHDDPAHRLAAFSASGSPLAAWPVFDDASYPYGSDSDGTKAAVAEPRAIAGGDLDGDGRPDLVLLCHDRVLIYLGGNP